MDILLVSVAAVPRRVQYPGSLLLIALVEVIFNLRDVADMVRESNVPDLFLVYHVPPYFRKHLQIARSYEFALRDGLKGQVVAVEVTDIVSQGLQLQLVELLVLLLVVGVVLRKLEVVDVASLLIILNIATLSIYPALLTIAVALLLVLLAVIAFEGGFFASDLYLDFIIKLDVGRLVACPGLTTLAVLCLGFQALVLFLNEFLYQ